MLESVSIQTSSGNFTIPHKQAHNGKVVFDCTGFSSESAKSFDIIIIFKEAISEFRNHDYTWVKANADFIAADFSPKILRLANGQYVQPNLQSGIWEFHKKNPKILLWRFNPENSAPLTAYSGPQNEKKTLQSNRKFDFPIPPAILFSNTAAVEFSRSVNPFSAIACFTDHCDFDTPENLKLQREFFKTNGISTTKGFFLNHFSKRKDNASFQNDASELTQWKNDGHELTYHSLSQSIKPMDESFGDFNNIIPPFPDIPTWIDHGFQPYNFSLFQNNGIPDAAFEASLKSKSITTLWNYIDSGTAASGVINQLNPDDFTLDRFSKGNKNVPFAERLGMMIKNIMFHFYADEKIISKYKNTASSFKKLVFQRKMGSFFTLLGSFFGMTLPILKVFLGWNANKTKPYKLARYTPLIFRHTIAESEFYVFQTLEMVDFKSALHPQNIEKLIREKGVFISHTYFSVPMNYHKGKMFRTADVIDEAVAANFGNLAIKIKNNEIWNPTLNELVVFLANFEKAVLDSDANGNITVANASGLPYRTVN